MCLEVNIGFEEALWSKVKLKKDYLLVGVCYRSPNSTDSNNQSLLDMFDHAMKVSDVARVLIMGDFNCFKINYTNGCVDSGASVFEYNCFEKAQDLLAHVFIELK